MKKLVIIGLAVVLAVTLGTGFGLAGDNIPSAKSAAFTADVTGFSPTDWTTFLTTQIKTGTPKDLVIDVSAECVLMTTAKLTGKDGEETKASIWVRVLVDGEEAMPGNVTFNSRTIKLSGDLTHVYIDPTGNETALEDHWIELFMETKTANAFNFIATDLGSGVHTIQVQAHIGGFSDQDPTNVLNRWAAMIGKATVVVDEVNLKTPAS